MIRRNNLRKRRSERNTYDVKELWQNHNEMLDMALLGHKPTVIADKLGCTSQTVVNVLGSSLGQQKLSAMREMRDRAAIAAAQELTDLIPKALLVYREILDSRSAKTLSLKKSTADTILKDLAGLKAPDKVEIDERSVHLHVEAIKERGLRAARKMGLIAQEIEPKETSET